MIPQRLDREESNAQHIGLVQQVPEIDNLEIIKANAPRALTYKLLQLKATVVFYCVNRVDVLIVAVHEKPQGLMVVCH